MRRLFIIGTQGIPADYGGLETFAEEVATRLAARGYPVCVTCEKTPNEPRGPSAYQGVDLLHLGVPDNDLRTIVADLKGLWHCYGRAEPGDIAYLLGYGVGPFAWPVLTALRAKGVKFWLNPDGLEWKRPRWPRWVQVYLWFSEWFLLRQADKIICDAEAIKAHHQRRWSVDPGRMDVIEYGAPVVEHESLSSEVLERRDDYLAQYDLEPGDYYTYVGRFVPDNNLELIVRGVLDDRIERRLLVLANHSDEDPFYQKLRNQVQTSGYPEKVIFTGGIYDNSLLQALRLGAQAYIHGHEVGGTNPALVEAMGLGNVILALNTPFNREVLGTAGLFFGKSVESFVRTVRRAERLSKEGIRQYQRRAVERVRTYYNWEHVTDKYEKRIWGASTRPTGTPALAGSPSWTSSPPS